MLKIKSVPLMYKSYNKGFKSFSASESQTGKNVDALDSHSRGIKRLYILKKKNLNVVHTNI